MRFCIDVEVDESGMGNFFFLTGGKGVGEERIRLSGFDFFLFMVFYLFYFWIKFLI